MLQLRGLCDKAVPGGHNTTFRAQKLLFDKNGTYALVALANMFNLH